MWPFKNKREKLEQQQREEQAKKYLRESYVEQLKEEHRIIDMFPIGKQFKYSGIDFTVSGMSTEFQSYGLPITRIVADYRNDKGDLKQHEFCIKIMKTIAEGDL